jgi:GT2 family glycosyltransferase
MISIIIPVKNDRRVEKLLIKLIKIPTPEEIEILVIDASEGSLDDIKKMFPSVKWIYFYNKTSKKYTFTEQVNLGLKKAKGNLVAFIDADCIPDKNWLIELAKPILTWGEDYVTGKVKSLGIPFHDKEWEKLNKVVYRTEAGSANSIFKKEIIKKIGYFDEQFEAGSDIDFTWRTTDLGYKIRYNKDAIIYDNWGNLQQEIKRAFRYGEARTRLYKKHPHRWKNLFGHDMVTLFYPLYIIFLPLTFFWPYYPLLILVPMIKNIKSQPLKVVFINLIFGFSVLKELFFPRKFRLLNHS